jgi:hypothetical protein
VVSANQLEVSVGSILFSPPLFCGRFGSVHGLPSGYGVMKDETVFVKV